jgi:outer membrane lipoprotein carrier protein
MLYFIVLSFGVELKYKTFESEFNQSIKSDNKTIFYKGMVKVNNGLIFWHYLQPIEKKIWVTLDKIYIYEPDLEQVTIYKKDKSDDIFGLIKNAKKIDNNLYLKHYNNKDIHFIIKNRIVTKIYYKDKIDNLVTLNFYNTKQKEFNLSTFTPLYPNYVDIIYAN